jgi:hypothetical protein
MTLTLVACGTKDDTMEQPVPDSAPATQEASAPAQGPDGAPASTNTLNDVVPEGPVGTLQLTDGTTVELTELIKLGNYYLYISGKLNGRSSTVVSLTRFRDLQRWEAFIFKDKNTFTITTKQGKELVFMDARLYLGSGSSDTYSFYTINDRFDKVQIDVKKSDVATITLK